MLVTLTTDFGLADPYVAEMKAVMLSINPSLQIVDITHQIKRFDVRMGAFVLASAAKYFPPRTIHVGVVDPGVGASRRPILIETMRSFYVGPDNGLLTLAARRDGSMISYHITNRGYMLPRVSRTFHGRDIFAPVAAHLSKGTPPSEFGAEIADAVTPTFVEPRLVEGKVVGEVIHADNFGNLITNIPLSALGWIGAKTNARVRLKVGEISRTVAVTQAYAEVQPNEALLIEGSAELLEISMNQGSAARSFKGKTGSRVEISRA